MQNIDDENVTLAYQLGKQPQYKTLAEPTPAPPGYALPTTIPQQVLDGIPGFLAWVAFVISIASAMFYPRIILLIAATLGFYSAARFLFAGIANFMGLRAIRQWEQRHWQAYYHQQKTEHTLAWDAVQHLVIIPNYKEPMPVLRRTLEGLKAQYEASRRLHIVLAMEASEEQATTKANTLLAEYEDHFASIRYTLHPVGLPGEMQCKSANESWAAREVTRLLLDEDGYEMDHICVTTMDADTRWHPHYFYALTALFALDERRYLRFWQAPIRYHGNIWEINPLLRIVNAYATAMELAYLAAPWWKALPMSSYSLSLRLLHESGYWDGDVIADEWHMFIKSYFARGGQVTVAPIMLPFMADATVGKGVLDELRERYLQTLRHAWGSKEIGYTVAQILTTPDVPKASALRLLFRIAHDILLAGPGWVLLTVGSQLPILLHPEIAPIDLATLLSNPQQAFADAAVNVAAEPTWILLGIAGLLVVVLGILFWFQDVIVRPPRTHKQTFTERLWTIASFLLLPVLTLIVLAIPAIQAQTRLLLGQPLQFRVSRKIS